MADFTQAMNNNRPTSVQDSSATRVLNNIYDTLNRQQATNSQFSRAQQGTTDAINELIDQQHQQNSREVVQSMAAARRDRAVNSALFGNINRTTSAVEDLKTSMKDGLKQLARTISDMFKKSLDSYDTLARELRAQHISTSEMARISRKSSEATLALKDIGLKVNDSEMKDFAVELQKSNVQTASLSKEQLGASMALAKHLGIDAKAAFTMASSFGPDMIQGVKEIIEKGGNTSTGKLLTKQLFQNEELQGILTRLAGQKYGGDKQKAVLDLQKNMQDLDKSVGNYIDPDALVKATVEISKTQALDLASVNSDILKGVFAFSENGQLSNEAFTKGIQNLINDTSLDNNNKFENIITALKGANIDDKLLQGITAARNARKAGNYIEKEGVEEGVDAFNQAAIGGKIATDVSHLVATIDGFTGGFLSDASSTINELFGDSLGISTIVTGGFGIISALLTKIIFKMNFGSILGNIQGGTSAAVSGISNTGKSLGGKLASVGKSIGGKISSASNFIGGKLLSVSKSIGKFLLPIGKTLLRFAGPVALIAGAATGGFILGKQLVEWFAPEWQKELEKAGGYLGALKKIWDYTVDEIIYPMGWNIAYFFTERIPWLWSQFTGSISNLWTWLGNWVSMGIEYLSKGVNYLNVLDATVGIWIIKAKGFIIDSVVHPIISNIGDIVGIFSKDKSKSIKEYADSLKVDNKKELEQANKTLEQLYKNISENDKTIEALSKANEELKIIPDNVLADKQEILNRLEVERSRQRSKELQAERNNKEENIEKQTIDLSSALDSTDIGKSIDSSISVSELIEYIKNTNSSVSNTNKLLTEIKSEISTSNTIAFAKGGIVSGPTSALIGEDGKEAVLPLTKPGELSKVLTSLSPVEKRNILQTIIRDKIKTKEGLITAIEDIISSRFVGPTMFDPSVITSGVASGKYKDEIDGIINSKYLRGIPWPLKASYANVLKKNIKVREKAYADSINNAGKRSPGNNLISGTPAARMLNWGLTKLGTPYILNSLGGIGYVCNEFVNAALANSGFDRKGFRIWGVGRTFSNINSGGKYTKDYPGFRLHTGLRPEEATPGMIFFSTRNNRDIPGHTGLVYYGNQIIHASGSSKSYTREGFLNGFSANSRGVSITPFSDSSKYAFLEFPDMYNADGYNPVLNNDLNKKLNPDNGVASKLESDISDISSESTLSEQQSLAKEAIDSVVEQTSGGARQAAVQYAKQAYTLLNNGNTDEIVSSLGSIIKYLRDIASSPANRRSMAPVARPGNLSF